MIQVWTEGMTVKGNVTNGNAVDLSREFTAIIAHCVQHFIPEGIRGGISSEYAFANMVANAICTANDLGANFNMEKFIDELIAMTSKPAFVHTFTISEEQANE